MNLNKQKQDNGLFSVTVRHEGHQDIEVPNVLFVSKFGSHLHGTTTPTSDVDLKGVFMASLSDIVLGVDSKTFNLTTGADDSRNGADDFDVEFIELRKFLRDAMRGQTYAVELLHVNGENMVFSTGLWDDVLTNKGELLTSNVKPFIGYCVAQAKKYGMKGTRLRHTEEALDYLRSLPDKITVEEALEGMSFNEHVYLEEKMLKGQEEPRTLLEVNSKQFDMALPLKDVVPVLENLASKYGARARRATDGIDWKSVSHVYRCIYEIKELLTTGQIQFPLAERDFLRAVKLGEIEYDTIQDELPLLIEEIDGLESELPSNPNRKFWDEWMLTTYREMGSF